MRILLVEDDENVMSVIYNFLDAAGHEVVAAANGQEAVEILNQKAVDLVLTDFQMPIKNGIELVRHVHSKLPATKTILMSGMIEEIEYAAFNAGVNALLKKPFQFKELENVLKKLAPIPIN